MHNWDTDASYKQAKQINTDFRAIVQYLIATEFNKTIFLDVKLLVNPINTLPLIRGYLSLSTSLDVMILYKRFKGDIILSTKMKNLGLVERKRLLDYDNDLATIIKKKNLTEDQKLIEFNVLRDELLFDPKVAAIIPSIIQKLPFNISYNTYILKNLNEYNVIIDTIQKNVIKDDIESFIPVGNSNAHPDFWHNKLLDIIKILPQEYQKACLENYHKFKLLEYDHDLL